jgi:3'-phosphoadenosine 5'-phosphosulfate sulfotransferase (PAPS reductase)/FAD synthetase
LDFELLLIDRIDAIKKIISKYGEENFVISFSGGKDSTVLSYLIDLAIPGNKIPRVFINTGIEYELITNFVNKLKEKDDRMVMIRPKYPLGKILKNYGYPFKSKEHSQLVHMYQQNGHSKSTMRYYDPPEERKRYGCPKILKYQFEQNIDLKISNECCNKLKKEPFNDWQLDNNKPYKITGERIAEGGLRASHGGCLVIDKGQKLKKFKPLNPMKDDWIDWLIRKYNIPLCELYYEPYNFQRSGCIACPYNIKIQDTLNTLNELLPNEYRKATLLWKPVYDEYIRIGYRLKQYPHKILNK